MRVILKVSYGIYGSLNPKKEKNGKYYFASDA